MTLEGQGAPADGILLFNGGEDPGSLDPAKYHQGLLQLARANGAEIIGHCEATQIKRVSEGFHITTSRGVIQARELVIATNGYSGALALITIAVPAGVTSVRCLPLR